jgi:NADH-quinone oxidoreductase subunit J
MYPFEIAAVILLVAIIAAIGLTMRRRPDSKYLDPAKQVVVKRQDRVRLVSVDTEKG